MNPDEPTPITDDRVAELPLARGRAQLLEAIMATPTLEPVRTDERAHGRWKASLGIAVAVAGVAAIAAAPLWLVGRSEERQPQAGSGLAASQGAGDPGSGGLYPVLEGLPPGWEFLNVGSVPIASVNYERSVDGDGRALSLLVEVRPANEYDDMVPAELPLGAQRAGTIDVDGRTAKVWHTARRPGSGSGPCTEDCAHHWVAVTPVEDGRFVVLFGGGLAAGTMAEDEWRALVRSVRLTDESSFEASLPADIVLPEEEAAAVADALTGVPLPPGFDAEDIDVFDYRTAEGTRRDVAMAATCAWVAEVRSGDEQRRSTAQAELAGLTQWPVLSTLEPQYQDLLRSVAADPGPSGEPGRLCSDRPTVAGLTIDTDGLRR